MPILGLHVEPLLGRVALAGGDPLLGLGFYVGSWETDLGTVRVVSWASGVASLFFEGSESPDLAAETLLAIRTFQRSHSDIVSFADDRVDGTAEIDPFEPRIESVAAIPVAPAFERPGPRPSSSPEFPLTAATPIDVPRPPDEVLPPVRSVEITRPEVQRVKQFDPTEQRFRAEELLRAALERPKTGSLGSVLATLQADQYALVTWPDDVPMIVQGGPGTGKSIVAVHRAAFLTNPWRPGGPVGSVALIGPTSRFVDHVKRAVDDLEAPPANTDLDSTPPVVLSLLGLLGDLAGVAFPDHRIVTDQEELADTDWRLLRFVQRAAARLRGPIGQDRPVTILKLVNALAKADPILASLLAGEGEIAAWCGQLGSYAQVSRSARYLPFLAACGLAVRPRTSAQKYDHLVVDEAQDVRPLEWAILTGMLRNPNSMSLFGDINQRRTDWSHQTWQDLAKDMEWTEDNGSFKVQNLRAGYRSTKQIIEFANQLLSSGERGHGAIQEGPQPVVIYAQGIGTLLEEVTRRTEQLVDEFRSGLVAVIAEGGHLDLIEERFVRQGWAQAPGDRNAWVKQGRSVGLLRPEAARGLEFEGVVVVPDDFPDNMGRTGLLYTSLTRAVRRLVVIHSRALPRALKAPR